MRTAPLTILGSHHVSLTWKATISLAMMRCSRSGGISNTFLRTQTPSLNFSTVVQQPRQRSQKSTYRANIQFVSKQSVPLHPTSNLIIWTADQRRDLPSCTVAIAMIASLRSGDPLPKQPAQHYGLSDVMTPRQLLYDPGFVNYPFTKCLRRSDPLGSAFGWTQAGNAHFFADSDHIQRYG